MTLQSLGGGSYSVTQGATLNFIYISSGSWGYPSGSTLLQGTLNLSSVAMVQGSTTSATATGSLAVAGGTFAGAFASGPGQVTIRLAVSRSLDTLVGTTDSITGGIDFPGTISTAYPTSPFKVITNSLSAGIIQQPYQAVLSASGGVTPYHWTLASGQLPPGLTLDDANGQIEGTPTQAGAFSFTVRADDSSQPQPATSSKTFTLSVSGVQLDVYGGAPRLPCPRGPAAYFYAQKLGNRWWLCTPAGNAFWMSGVYDVEPNGRLDYAGVRYKNIAIAKYGDADLTWGPQQNRRLKSWGFNSVAEFSVIWVQATATHPSWPSGQQPVPIPFTGLIQASEYALRNLGNYANGPVKDLVRATNPSVFIGYRAHSPDIWDPNYSMWIDGCLQKDPIVSQWINGPNNSYFVGIHVDHTDSLQGFGAGPDFKTVVDGQPTGGREQPHLAWIVLITPPSQTQNAELGVTYTDTTVYSKRALANFLQQRYGVIFLLNLAWGSNYTTFESNGGWGTGTGLLDEDGRHSWVPKDYIYLSDANPNLKKDVDDFLFLHAQMYFSQIKSVLSSRAPGRLYLGPTVLSSWGSPPRHQILQAAANYIDVYMAGSIPAGVADDQQRVDFIAQNLGDKPWLEWEGFVANPDSYMYPFPQQPLGNTSQVSRTTQAERGQAYTNMVDLLLNSRTSSGTYPIVGFKWWQLVDNAEEGLNWGLVTRRDNEYDGLAARAASGADSWGFPTGGEDMDYGNFLGAVQNANSSIWQTLLSRNW